MMTTIDKFITYAKTAFSNDFAVFDNRLNCIYNEHIKLDTLEEIRNLLKKYPDINTDKDFTFQEMTFDEKSYFLVACCKEDKEKHYEDDFLNRVSFLFDDVDYGIVILVNGIVGYRNLFLADYLGISIDNKDTDAMFNMLTKETSRTIQEFVSSKNLAQAEVQLELKSGAKTWVTLGRNEYHIKDNQYIVISLNDFNEEKQQEEQKIAEIEYLNRTLESIQEGVIILDQLNRITLFNHNVEEFTGKNKESVFYKNVYNEIFILDKDLEPLRYWEKEFSNQDVILVTSDGLHRFLRMNVSNILSKTNEIMGKVIVLIDIADSKRREEEILYLSYHDVLTGLYNRTFFEEEIKRLDTKRQLPLSIIMGDVNGLKLTNDVFGHIAGDELLRKVGDILKGAARSEDIIARWGGDEFIILLPETDSGGAQALVERINQQFLLDDNQRFMQGFSPSISLGFAVKSEEAQDIYEILKIAESNMYKRKMLSKESIYSSVITSMKTALYEKSNETEDHTNRLYDYCKVISKHYDMSKDELNELEILCMLHDIGKIGIDDNILKKPGKLTDEEWVEMKKHPEIGFRIAQATPELAKVALFILYHHEKFDGTGYPKGLKSYEIPLINRILSVADAFDAMTHDRTYRKALTLDNAIKELDENKGKQFDPYVVQIFLEEIKKGSIN